MTDNVHIRLTLTRGVKITSGMDPRLNQSGPTLIVLAEHKPPVYDKSGITLITSSVRRTPPDSLDPKIHHNNLLTSILAKIEANNAGADDAVMLDHRGFIAETNATNIFLVTGGLLATPTAAACPEGITRAAVLELAADAGIPHVIGDYSLTELYTADEVFVTGTMGGIAPVISVDGRTDRLRRGRAGHRAAGQAAGRANRPHRHPSRLTPRRPARPGPGGLTGPGRARPAGGPDPSGRARTGRGGPDRGGRARPRAGPRRMDVMAEQSEIPGVTLASGVVMPARRFRYLAAAREAGVSGGAHRARLRLPAHRHGDDVPQRGGDRPRHPR